MFSLGVPELMVILVIGVVLFGSRKLRSLAADLAKLFATLGGAWPASTK